MSLASVRDGPGRLAARLSEVYFWRSGQQSSHDQDLLVHDGTQPLAQL
jgi:hypothetical protein